MQNRKPKVFIGSARESIKYVNAIHRALKYFAEVTPWHAGTFEANNTTMEDLEKRLAVSDFAIFVFSPDDVITMRNKTHLVPRDNSIFELGLFWGKLKKERVFFIVPDNVMKTVDGSEINSFHIPSDLQGLTLLQYEIRELEEYDASVNTACDTISERIEKLGVFSDPAVQLNKARKELTQKDSILSFFVQFSKDMIAAPEKKYEFLYDAFRTAYNTSALNGHKVVGAAIWKKRGSEGIEQVAGNVGRGRFYPFDINEQKKEGEQKILVVDAYLTSTIQCVLYTKHIAKVYLLCYPLGRELVVTVHLSGPQASQSDLDKLTDQNQELLDTINYLFGGDAT